MNIRICQKKTHRKTFTTKDAALAYKTKIAHAWHTVDVWDLGAAGVTTESGKPRKGFMVFCKGKWLN